MLFSEVPLPLQEFRSCVGSLWAAVVVGGFGGSSRPTLAFLSIIYNLFTKWAFSIRYNMGKNIGKEETTMARASVKKNKTPYQVTRENLGLTREKASELLETVSPERIEKIENERTEPHPDEVLLMANKYRQPGLCNYYCANQCPIGQQYVPQIEAKALPQIVREMLASLNSARKRQERLIEITVDGTITDDELTDFVYIQEELEQISLAVEALQLWSERMLATGAIDREQYQKARANLRKEAE